MQNVILTPIDADILIHRIAERTVELLKREQPKSIPIPGSENLITREEALKFLKVTPATLWRWEKEGKIQSYGMGGKRYFRKSELEASLIAKK